MINGSKSLQPSMQFQNLMHARCEVCDSTISRFDSLAIKDLGYSVCRSFNCRRIMSQKSTMTPLLFKSNVLFNKNLILRQREKDLVRKNHIEDVIEKESLGKPENNAVNVV